MKDLVEISYIDRTHRESGETECRNIFIFLIFLIICLYNLFNSFFSETQLRQYTKDFGENSYIERSICKSTCVIPFIALSLLIGHLSEIIYRRMTPLFSYLG